MGIGSTVRCGALLALLSGGMALAQPVKVVPVDEAAGDATWTRFRARLIESLLKRDQKFVEIGRAHV